MTPETGPNVFKEIAGAQRPAAETAYGQAVLNGTAGSGDIFPDQDEGGLDADLEDEIRVVEVDETGPIPRVVVHVPISKLLGE